MPTNPLDEALRQRSLLRGLWELTPLGGGYKALSDYKIFADRERASGSLLGDYLTALEPVEQIGSDLLESGQMVSNAIQAGTGVGAGLLAKASPLQFTPTGMYGAEDPVVNAYERSYQKRLPKDLPQEFDPLAMGAYLEAAPGPGDVTMEAAIAEPTNAAERVIKNLGALALNVVADPANAATGGMNAAADLASSGRYADAAAQLLGSPLAGAVYAPDIIQGVEQGAQIALDPTRSMGERIEAAVQGAATAGLGGLMARGLAMEASPRSFSDRIALKREAKAQGLDDVPQPVPVAPPPSVPQEAPQAALPTREPQILPEPAYEAPRRPQEALAEQPQPVVGPEPARPQDLVVAPEVPPYEFPFPDPSSRVTEREFDVARRAIQSGNRPDKAERLAHLERLRAQADQIGVAPEARPADIEPSAPIPPVEAEAAPIEPVQPIAPSTPRGQEPTVDVPFQFPLDEVAPEARPRAEQVATDLAARFADEGRFDQAALDEAATDPAIAPYADQIKRHAVLEASALIQGRGFLDDVRDFHGDQGPDGVEIVPAAGKGGGVADPGTSYDVVQRKDGRVVGAASVRDGVLTMVAGGRKMGSPESIRPVYEALDQAGAKRNDLLTVLGAQSRRTKLGRDAEAGRVPEVPVETRAPRIGSEPRSGDAGRVPEALERSAASHPLDRDEPLPVRQLIDQTRLRLDQHRRTKAPEATVAHDLGSAVYHVVASGLKKTLPQVRGWIKRHLGTWLRKVGFSGEKLNAAIARAYEAAGARFRDYKLRLADPLSDPKQRGAISTAKSAKPSGVSREEIDRQLRQSPELRGMARAQLESVATSAGKPMTRLNTEDIRQAFPGDDENSRYTRALLNRVAAAERAKEAVEPGDALTEQLQASLAAPEPVRGPKKLDNPRSKSGKVRVETPAATERKVAAQHATEIRKEFESAEAEARHVQGMKETIAASNLPDDLKVRLTAVAKDATRATGAGDIVRLEDLDPGVRAALRLRTDADLKRLIRAHGGKVSQAEMAAFKLAVQDQASITRGKLYKWRTATTDKARAEAMSEYVDSQLVQAANLRAFAGDTPAAARIEKARTAVKETDAVRKLFASLRPDTRATITDRQAATIASLMRETMEGRRPASELAEAIQAATKPTKLDKILEWWKAGLLSGPPTHIANFLGNTTNLMLDLAKTGVAGGLDVLASRGQLGSPKKARSRYVSDVGASIHGIMGAMGPAFREFGREMANLATLKPEKFDLNAGRFEHQVGAIGGTLGRVVRSPFRALGAADGFFRTLLNASEQFKEANRAVERRIEMGDVDRAEKAEFMADWLEKLRDPENARQFEAVKDRIQTEVRKGLFQQDADELTRYVQRVLHTPVGKLGQFFVPFVSTPVNILKTTARYTPAGALAARLRANRLVDADVNAAAIDDMAKGLVGTVAGMGLLALAQAGVITGSGPTDPRERTLKEKTGWKPRSLRLQLGDKTFYVPIDRIEPLGTLFGLAGDIAELKDEKKSGDAFSKLVGMLKDNVLEKSYLEGLGNLFELASDPERHGASFLRSFAGSWVPAISGRIAQGLDPIVRDTRGEGDSPMARIADSIRKSMQARVPGLSQQLEARRDPTGAPLERSGNFVTRAIIPSAISEEKAGPQAEVARELLRIGFTPGEPRQEMVISGRRIELTQEEFAKLQDAKEKASAEVAQVMRQASYSRLPDSVEEGGQASKEAVVRRIYQGYQERARHELYRTPRLARERRRAEAQRMPNVRIDFSGR